MSEPMDAWKAAWDIEFNAAIAAGAPQGIAQTRARNAASAALNAFHQAKKEPKSYRRGG